MSLLLNETTIAGTCSAHLTLLEPVLPADFSPISRRALAEGPVGTFNLFAPRNGPLLLAAPR